MFSEKEKRVIVKNFRDVVKRKHPTANQIRAATRGIYPWQEDKIDLKQLKDIDRDGKEPIVHDDSTSGWMHVAISRFGLTVGDIRAMKFGQKMEVVLMDRNVGDYTHGLKGFFNPAKVGFSYATYIHGDNLTGILMFDIGVIHAPFTWEINLAAVGIDMFWGPIGDCSNKNVDKNKLDSAILVGWRGPAIDRKHLKSLPNKIKMYNTWWDDYGTTKYKDWLHKQ